MDLQCESNQPILNPERFAFPVNRAVGHNFKDFITFLNLIKAVDEEGLETERRCFQVSTTELFYTNIHEMAQAYLIGTSGKVSIIILEHDSYE